MMWQTQTTIEYPFALRPASIEEAGLFYSQMDEAEDAVLGTVGHIRMDFGASGKEFYHTWWPHNGDQFNTGEFKDELQKFVDMLRSDGPLTNLASMRNYCYQHGGKITEDAEYDLENSQVCDALKVILCREDGFDYEMAYQLNAEEKSAILDKMGQYCREKYGQSLLEFAAEMESEITAMETPQM